MASVQLKLSLATHGTARAQASQAWFQQPRFLNHCVSHLLSIVITYIYIHIYIYTYDSYDIIWYYMILWQTSSVFLPVWQFKQFKPPVLLAYLASNPHFCWLNPGMPPIQSAFFSTWNWAPLVSGAPQRLPSVPHCLTATTATFAARMRFSTDALTATTREHRMGSNHQHSSTIVAQNTGAFVNK